MLAQPRPAQHETLVTPVQGATPVTFTPDYAGGMQPHRIGGHGNGGRGVRGACPEHCMLITASYERRGAAQLASPPPTVPGPALPAAHPHNTDAITQTDERCAKRCRMLMTVLIEPPLRR